jgi:hypothetical protein
MTTTLVLHSVGASTLGIAVATGAINNTRRGRRLGGAYGPERDPQDSVHPAGE